MVLWWPRSVTFGRIWNLSNGGWRFVKLDLSGLSWDVAALVVAVSSALWQSGPAHRPELWALLMNFQVFAESFLFDGCIVKYFILHLMTYLCIFSYLSVSVCAQLRGSRGRWTMGWKPWRQHTAVASAQKLRATALTWYEGGANLVTY